MTQNTKLVCSYKYSMMKSIGAYAYSEQIPSIVYGFCNAIPHEYGTVQSSKYLTCPASTWSTMAHSGTTPLLSDEPGSVPSRYPERPLLA